MKNTVTSTVVTGLNFYMSEKTRLRSMTGYAVVERKVLEKNYRFHLKSVNHRFIEFRARLPRKWLSFETEIRLLAQKKLERGSLDCWVEESESENDAKNLTDVTTLFSELSRAIKTAGQEALDSARIRKR